MKQLEFEWDDNKNRTNSKKHGVSFDEARTVFYDESAIQFFDPEHSENEDRFILLGTSFKLKTLVVCHCFRQEETVVRIISARKADKDEEQVYWSEKNERSL
ncbi:MAG: BrnT family toxin [Thiomicrorhabdus sp.]|nr:BrnT family toxin [Thiomicrorhabdus sp.]